MRPLTVFLLTSSLLLSSSFVAAKQVHGVASVTIMNSAPSASYQRGRMAEVNGEMTFVPSVIKIDGKRIYTESPSVLSLSGVAPYSPFTVSVTRKTNVFYASEVKSPSQERSKLGYTTQEINNDGALLTSTTSRAGIAELAIYTNGELNEAVAPNSNTDMMVSYSLDVNF